MNVVKREGTVTWGAFMNPDSIAEILQQIRSRITDDSDMVFTRFDTPQELRLVIDSHINKLRNGDLSDYFQLTLLFGPTGVFQEHSLSNGWGNEFLMLAGQFDKA